MAGPKREPRHNPHSLADVPTGVRRGRSAHRVLLPAAIALLASLAIGAIDSATPPLDSDIAPGSNEATGKAVRACDLSSARTALDDGGRDGRVLSGLVARACAAHEVAFELLSMSPDPSHRWEDWRLLALAEAAAALGRHEPGSAAVDTLLAEHDKSPLYPLAYPIGVTIARQADDAERALALVRTSRGYPLPPEVRSDLDVQAWEIARELERPADLRESGRELLLHSPADASDLDVEELFHSDAGVVNWTALFTRREIAVRAANLLDAKMAEEAIETLLAVPPENRDVTWHLLHGQSLVDLRRGVDGLDALEGVEAADLDTAQDLEWLRAEAALDAATARRGRRNLSATEREQMKLLAHGHLRKVAQLDSGSQRGIDALRLLFEELADGEHFEQVRSILQRLSALDPDDTSGTRYLWGLGWAEYSQRNPSGAIGYWSELVDIYPHTNAARRGRYWTARSHEALGNADRSRTLYEMLVSAPSIDYYGKLARERLGLDPRLEAPLSGDATADWPRDPVLDRTETLSDVGLDGLALTELDQLRELTGTRTERALRSRILARQGRRRESIQNLWRAFPVLGGAYQDAVPPEALRMYYPLDYLDVVQRFARDNDLDVSLLLAMIRQESAFDISARSWAGARGLMQVMPATGRELAAKMGLEYSTRRLNEPSFSVQLGSRYFRQVLDMFDGRLELALAGYNAGPYRIRRLVREAGSDLEIDSFLESLRFEESKTYVRRIVLFSDSYQRLYPDLG